MAGGWGGEPTDANISVGILVKDADGVLACHLVHCHVYNRPSLVLVLSQMNALTSSLNLIYFKIIIPSALGLADVPMKILYTFLVSAARDHGLRLLGFSFCNLILRPAAKYAQHPVVRQPLSVRFSQGGAPKTKLFSPVV